MTSGPITGKGKGPVTGSKVSKNKAKKKPRGFLIAMTTVGALGLGAVALTGVSLFNNVISPSVKHIDEQLKGSTALLAFGDAVATSNTEELNAIVEKSYLAQEKSYGGTNKVRTEFPAAVMSTVKYSIAEVDVLDKNGNPVFDSTGTERVKQVDPLMSSSSDSVKLTLVDWSSLPLEESDVLPYTESIDKEDPDYRNKLTDAFAQYVLDLSSGIKKESEVKEDKKEEDSVEAKEEAPTEEPLEAPAEIALPTQTIDWVPALEEYGSGDNKGFQVSATEDESLDRVLFSSREFYTAQLKFSEVATGEQASAEYMTWLGLEPVVESEEVKDSASEEEGENLNLDSLKEELTTIPEEPAEESTNEPIMPIPGEVQMAGVGNPLMIDPLWIGAWMLQQGIVLDAEYFLGEEADTSAKRPPVGTGAKDSPAGLSTRVDTIQFGKDAEGKTIKIPIRVALSEVYEGDKAIEFFQAKDTRNRGFTTASDLVYVAFRFEVTNLGREEITIKDNSILSDDQVNTTGRTGKIYGLKESVKLKPGESGVIESWASSPNLSAMYLIWGADFDRKHDVSWFRTLAGSEGEIISRRTEEIPGSTKAPEGSVDQGTEEPVETE